MNLNEHLTNPIFKIISEVADTAKLETYVVGGFVRDTLLNRKQDKTDIDFVCVGSGIDLAQQVSKKLGRLYTGVELNEEYHKLINERTSQMEMFI